MKGRPCGCGGCHFLQARRSSNTGYWVTPVPQRGPCANDNSMQCPKLTTPSIALLGPRKLTAAGLIQQYVYD